jgi:hypothetical protein
MKNFHRIDPYTSSNENEYFRGIAIEKKIGKIRGSFFYSNKFRDANIVDLPESNKLTVSSFQQTGYHRLPRELKDEDALRENVYGGSLSLNKPLFRVSLNGLHCAYDGSLLQGSKPYQFFRFSGNSSTTFSLDYRLSLNRFYIFGEEAFSANGGKAFLNGIYGQLSSGLGMVLLHRKYDKNFHSLFAGAFSENTKPQNETGLYGGLQINVLPALTFKGYLDVYRFPWLNYLVDAPSEGWEGLMNLEYTFGEESSMYFRFRRSQDMKNYREEEEKISRLIEKKKTKLRYHLKYRLNRHLILKNRVETVFTRLQNFTSGFMMYQDVSCRPKNNPFSVDFRYAVFDIEDYENRIYAYENDLLYVFSVPAYYGRGSRIYINIKYQLGNVDFWLKLSRTDYSDRESIGSGLNAIDGHTKTRAKLMMRFTF